MHRVRRADCLAKHGVEDVVQAAKLEGMAHMGARCAVSEDLDTEPCEQRERHADARRPVQEIAPDSLVDHQHEEVDAEVDGSPPPLRRE